MCRHWQQVKTYPAAREDIKRSELFLWVESDRLINPEFAMPATRRRDRPAA
jgi:hypothetical protein